MESRQEPVQLLLRHSVVDEVFLKIGGDRMDWLMVPIDIKLAVLQPVVLNRKMIEGIILA